MNGEHCTRGATRRGFLEKAAIGALAVGAGPAIATADETSRQPGGQGDTVRDRFWIFTVFAGGDNEGYGLPRPSRMTPAEAAFYLGVPNLLFIRSGGHPPLGLFEQWALPFRPLKRVVWSLVGAGGVTADDERRRVFELARRFPNIVGFMMDDFFHGDGSGALSPQQLQDLRSHFLIDGRPHELYVTLYTHQLGLPIQRHLEFCDNITLWTWNSKDLKDLEKNFDRLEKIAPKNKKLLGCYLWDYGNKAAMPVDRMQRQCELGLKWLREKRLQGLIFLGNTCCDLELGSVEWSRKWIAEVGETAIA
jgi:hypothetical protein